MADEYYQSVYSGEQIDDALGRIVNGELDSLAATAINAGQAAQSALSGVQTAIKNIPKGATPIMNDLTTGGVNAALSAEMGKVLGQRPNPNLLDNWYFVNPINQRKETEYRGIYGIDRWRSNLDNTIKFEVVDGGIRVSNIGESYSYFHQPFERALPAGTYTFSVLIEEATGSSSLYLGTGTGPITCGVGLKSSTVTISDNQIRKIQFTLGSGASIKIVAIKLERGSVQTLAHQDSDGAWVMNDPPPDSQQMLEKCSRYQIVTKGSGVYSLANGVASSATTIHFLCVTPTFLRTNPNVSFKNLVVRCAADSASLPITKLERYGLAGNILWLRATVDGATPGAPCQLRTTDDFELILDSNL